MVPSGGRIDYLIKKSKKNRLPRARQAGPGPSHRRTGGAARRGVQCRADPEKAAVRGHGTAAACERRLKSD